MSLRTAQLTSLWGVADRRMRAILGELEALGFTLEVDDYGGRRVPEALAEAVKATRQAGLELRTLRDREDMQPYLPHSERGTAVDPLGTLIETRAEIAILREAVAAVWAAAKDSPVSSSYREPSWGFLTLPDPRRGL